MTDRRQNKSELISLFQTGRKLQYKRGEIILRAGDEPQGVYMIESGLVKIYALSNNGEERIHLFYADYDVFPLMWAFKDAVRNVYYQAIDEVTLWIVPRDTFLKYVAEHPGAANNLLQQAVGMFRLYAGRIDNLLRSSSYERTAHLLVSLVARFGLKLPNGSYCLNAPLTHQDLASAINLSRETTSRALERMKRKGIVSYAPDKRQIVILSLEQLIKIVGEEEVESIWPNLGLTT